MANLLSLPPDLIIQEILNLLPASHLAACQMTCHALNSLITESSLLTYRKELEIAGLLDNPRCNYPISTRLEMLFQREKLWLHLEPHARDWEVPPDISEYFEIESGVFLLGKLQDGAMTGIYCSRLSSMDWEEFDIGKEVLDFGLAVEEHDLVSVITRSLSLSGTPQMEVHFLSYSTGESHPLALQPYLYIPTPDLNEQQPGFLSNVKISGDNLAITLRYPCRSTGPVVTQVILHVWNWKTGEMKGELLVPNLDIVFLREDLLLVANDELRSLDIYHISSSSSPSVFQTPSMSQSIYLAYRFSFPELRRSAGFLSMQCRSDPPPRSQIAPSLPHASTSQPFVTDPAYAVLLIIFSTYQHGGVGRRGFCMIVDRHSLLTRVLKSMTVSRGSCEDTVYPVPTMHWKGWGPQSARLIPLNPDINLYITCSRGSRFAYLAEVHDMDDVGVEHLDAGIPHIYREDVHIEPSLRLLYVLDFGAMKVRRARQLVEAAAKVGKEINFSVVDTPSVYPSEGREFVEDIVTCLPYIRSVYLSEEGEDVEDDLPFPQPDPPHREWDGVILDEQHILGFPDYGLLGDFIGSQVRLLSLG